MSHSHLYLHMRAQFWRGPTAVSKKVSFKFISRLFIHSWIDWLHDLQIQPCFTLLSFLHCRTEVFGKESAVRGINIRGQHCGCGVTRNDGLCSVNMCAAVFLSSSYITISKTRYCGIYVLFSFSFSAFSDSNPFLKKT